MGCHFHLSPFSLHKWHQLRNAAGHQPNWTLHSQPFPSFPSHSFAYLQATSGIDSEMMPVGSPTGSSTMMGGGGFNNISGASSGLVRLSMGGGGGGGGGGASGMGGLCQTIDASELTLQKIIGNGAYGKVRAGWGRGEVGVTLQIIGDRAYGKVRTGQGRSGRGGRSAPQGEGLGAPVPALV